MIFNSIAYGIFLPLVFFVYWIIPHKYRWILLLSASYFFYMSWNPEYVILIIITTLVSYFCGIGVSRAKNQKAKKLCLGCSLVVILGILFIFKYFNFVLENVFNIMHFWGMNPRPITAKLLLPVGISFYTFQTIAYVVDVYRENIKPEKNIGIYATFISFFPQLVAGPIERASNLLPQIKSEKSFDYDMAMYGARQILWGLFKKIAVADVLAFYVDRAYNNPSLCSREDAVIAVLFFSFQIYCDFSAYSDIAIGSAKLLGINLMTNFKSPYYSTSIKEFWSRWHISLSTWLKDYVYIPLGGNRCSTIKKYRNLFITFMISGLWHGANWTFVLWGGMHGIAQIIERCFKLDRIKRCVFTRVISWVIVFIFCSYAWVFFRADTFSDALTIIHCTFSNILDISSYAHGSGATSYAIALEMIVIVAVFDFCSLKHDILFETANLKGYKRILRILVEYLLVILIVFFINNGIDSNQFVYFQF